VGKSDIGLIGLAVMGQNLVLNMASRGYRVAVYNRTTSKTEEFLAGPASGKSIVGASTLKEFVDQLDRPRKVMLMVQAGTAVDAVINDLVPLLDQGDLIIDGGNSYFKDTRRRAADLSARGILYLGAGISGGEEGALTGPSIMPGGDEAAWKLAESILIDISAKVNGEPCCAYIGADGAGHFVKMVHNGIEYGDMQLICEAYFLMREVLGLSAERMASIFRAWNEGDLQSYLIEITGDILATTDPKTGKPLVDVIKDTAGQKGTGKWTSQEALDLGVGAPTITEAVYARFLSAIRDERIAASALLQGPDVEPYEGDPDELIQAIEAALFAAKICSYAQGFALLSESAKAYGWNLNLGEIASLWRGGCIIRAQFLDSIREAYDRDPSLENLLLDPYFTDVLHRSQAAWRRVVSLAAQRGIATPGFSSALAYFDQYRTARLPANLLQAQRDYFGAHTYERLDEDGVFHTEWTALAKR